MKKIHAEDLCYPHVVHCRTKEEHKRIKRVSPKSTGWNEAYGYYLVGGDGFARTKEEYTKGLCPDGEKYTVYEFDEIDFGDSTYFLTYN